MQFLKEFTDGISGVLAVALEIFLDNLKLHVNINKFSLIVTLCVNTSEGRKACSLKNSEMGVLTSLARSLSRNHSGEMENGFLSRSLSFPNKYLAAQLQNIVFMQLNLWSLCVFLERRNIFMLKTFFFLDKNMGSLTVDFYLAHIQVHICDCFF